jgi:hypothetical protein
MSARFSVDFYIETGAMPGLRRSLALLAGSVLGCILALASTQCIAETILGPVCVTEFVDFELGIMVGIAQW